MSENLVDRCAASGQHDAARTNPDLWKSTVAVIGRQDDGKGGAFEIGNCRDCGSTIAHTPKE
jgi:hypothetical protein